jgi:uncharacterized protein (TIGR00369 family)
MQGKKVQDSRLVSTHLIQPHQANIAGNAHGGAIMYLIDNTAGAVALRHARSNAVTASIDRLDFHHPAFVGDLITLYASVNFVGRTSMEIGVRVETENLQTGQCRHSSSAYLTFVALDEEGRPMPLPPLILESDEEFRRYAEAKQRKQMRLAERVKEKQGQGGESCR